MRKHTRSLAAGLASVAALVALTACSTSAPAATTTADVVDASEGGIVAISFPTLDVQLWNVLIERATVALEAEGYDLLVDNANMDIQAQANAWETWINRGDIDAIMGYPVQSDSLVAVTEQATAAGIPVLGYGVGWEGIDGQLVVDNYEDGVALGTLAGEWILENEDADVTVDVALLGYWENDLTRDRSQGIIDGLEASGANVSVSELTAATLDEGYSVTQAQLAATPDTAVWLAYGADPALGAYQALMDAGVAADDADVLIGSVDVTNDVLDLLTQPESIWRLALGTDVQDIADAVVELLTSAARGELAGDVIVTSQQVTPANADSFRTE